ncbi:MAG: phosphoenolpyruvate synthase, partial [Psychroserpens sp.]|nr:phosphoenolpyruvate synthase [Psychroserpens sp.]
MRNYLISFDNVTLQDLNMVGGKNASLGEMMQVTKSLGIEVPKGFALTTSAYQEFLETNNLVEFINLTIKDLNIESIASLQAVGMKIRNKIMAGEIPKHIEADIIHFYENLSRNYKDSKFTDVAVRSSATAEDLPNASFAGQQETYLNVNSTKELLLSIKKCYASLFTDRAISYRDTMKFNHSDVLLSVGIQKMVRSDIGTSGVAFSIDTESGFKDVVVINANYGLGELLVQGSISPDEYVVFKKNMSIIEKKLGAKSKKMVYGDNVELTRIVDVPQNKANSFCLSESQIKQLASWVMKIEDHYSGAYQKYCPVDVEWAIDGVTNKLYIVQARPETIHSNKITGEVEHYKIEKDETQFPILEGNAIGDKIGVGKIHILHSIEEIINFKKGDVLVTEMTDPDWEPIMKIASAIITNKGG